MKQMLNLVGIVFLASLISFGCQNSLTPLGLDNPGLSNLALQNAAIGNFVWNDEDMDGIQDDGESGLSNVTVNLYDCNDSLIAVDTTDSEGHYIFEGLDAGSYYLAFAAPDSFQFSPQDQGDSDLIDSDPNPDNGTTECFELAEDAEDVTRDAGLYMMEYDGCTRGKGFWKNHCGMGPQDDLVSDLLPLWLGNEDGEHSMNIETVQMAYEILGQQTYGTPSNGITKLYAHFLTAKLNIANGANDEDIAELIGEVDTFLAEHDYEGWSDLSREDKQMVNQWKGMLEGYDEGEIGPGSCGDHLSEDR